MPAPENGLFRREGTAVEEAREATAVGAEVFGKDALVGAARVHRLAVAAVGFTVALCGANCWLGFS